MIIYEIENMETNELSYVQAASEGEMKAQLKNKGFKDCCGMFLAGINSSGEEVSAMAATFPHVSQLRDVKGQ